MNEDSLTEEEGATSSDEETLLSLDESRANNTSLVQSTTQIVSYPNETTAERLGRLAIASFLKPSSENNIFNAFFKSTYLKDSWVHYSLTQPVPNITYGHLKLAMTLLVISFVVQLKYSRETRIWARDIAHKGLLIATLFSMSGISIVALVKFLLDKSREAREREEKQKIQVASNISNGASLNRALQNSNM